MWNVEFRFFRTYSAEAFEAKWEVFVHARVGQHPFISILTCVALVFDRSSGRGPCHRQFLGSKGVWTPTLADSHRCLSRLHTCIVAA